MTIVASVKVYDGIILGADSATQVFGKLPDGKMAILKTYQNAIKLFQFQDLPIGILTYGAGNVEEKSISTLLREFSNTHKYNKDDYQIKDIVKSLLDYFRKIYLDKYKDLKRDDNPTLGMVVAGYSQAASLGEEWEFSIPKDEEPKRLREANIFGASWRGIMLPFTRIYKGFDPRIRTDLANAGVSPELIESVFSKYSAPIAFNGMPVKDAIDFVRFILKTTIWMSSFEIGRPTCSEPICIAVITPDKGFKYEDEYLEGGR